MDALNQKNALLEMIEQHIQLNDPPKIKQTFERLLLSGYSPENALEKLRAVAAEEVWVILQRRGNISPDELKALLGRRLE